MTRDYFKILLVGASGKGKTYSFRNMNPETTGFINVENKPLPFKNNLKHHTRITSMEDAKNALAKYAKDPVINCIVFDSLSAYTDMVLARARETKRGFDVWNFYNEEIAKLLTFIKSIEKEIFVTAHYEWIQDEGGAKEKRVKTKGKEWEGVIEKEFTIVLYTDNKFDDKKPIYSFHTVMQDSSTKCPPDIFGADVYSLDNDANHVLNKIIEFTK